ncbi:hypothetical protein [Paenibacillus gansuensis]|uniref:Uncharacterized protein n=1 Tax=Paenibacillus gansuensis TaxID=306542 RepID=A0ABW5P7G6_9BACL
MGFNRHYGTWITESTGERLRRLGEHGHAEVMFLDKVWWPAVGSFDHLLAEWEVEDSRGSRFLDFAYIRTPHLRQHFPLSFLA